MPLIDEPADPQAQFSPGVTSPTADAMTLGPNTPVFWGQGDDSPTIAAAFRQDSFVGSRLTRQTAGVDNTPDPSYSAWKDIQGTPYEDHWASFVGSNNAGYTATMKRQIDMENQDKRTLAAAGWRGTLAELGAGTAETLLIPGAAGLDIVKGGGGLVYAALKEGASVGLSVAAQEAGLQSTQETRPLSESAMNIGGGILLGSLLGAGAHALMSPGEAAAAGDAFKGLHNGEPDPVAAAPGAPQAAGAAPVDHLSTADLSVAGPVANQIAEKSAFMAPGLRLNYSPVADVRQTAQELVENTMYQAVNAGGGTVGPAAETLGRVDYEGRLGQAVQESEQLFSDMKKADGAPNMSRNQFEEATGAAMRNGDVDPDGNGYVTQAAQSWRARVFDPFFQEAQAHGLIPDDVSVDTAPSYFSRVYNVERMNAHEPAWHDAVQPHVEGQMQAAYATDRNLVNARLAKLDQRSADLMLSPDDRAAALDSLRGQGDALDAANPDHLDTLDNINDLRGQARAAEQAGDTAGGATLREQAAELREAGGDGLRDYARQRGELRGRYRQVDFGQAGIAGRREAALQRIEDLRDQNQRSVLRMVAKGKQLATESIRLDPRRLEARIAAHEASFEALASRAQRSAERTQAQLDAFDADLATRAGKMGNDPAALAAYTDKARARDGYVRGKLADEATRQAGYSERVSRLADRIEAVRGLDREARLAEIQAATDKLAGEVSDLGLARGERVAAMKDRLDNLDPAQIGQQIEAIGAKKAELRAGFNDRWKREHLGEGVDLDRDGTPDFHEAARQVSQDVFDKITGRASATFGHDLPEYSTPVTIGPMKDRTFNVPDKVIAPFLRSNVREVGTRYARRMASEIALTRKFGRADMADQFQRITDGYRNLRERVSAAPTDEAAVQITGRAPGTLAAVRAGLGQTPTRGQLLTWLAKREAQDTSDLRGMRDLIRGTYKNANASGIGGKLAKTALTFNYVRNMGGVLLTRLPELYRPAMVHGLGPFMREGLAPLLNNLAAVKLSVAEAQRAGLVLERVLQHRISTLSEMGDPYLHGSGYERFLGNLNHVATTWSGHTHWTDAIQSVGSVLSQNRVLAAAAGEGDTRFMAYLGLDPTMSARIGREFGAHGSTDGNVKIANTEAWTDQAAARAYRAAINKDVNSILVRGGVGDAPLMSRTPTGRVLTQFMGYNFAAHQKVMLRGLQEGPTRFVGATVAMTSIGMLGAYLKAVRGGAARLAQWEQDARNPGFLIAEGLDGSGIFPMMFNLADRAETVTKGTGLGTFNPIKTPLMAMAGRGGQADSIRASARDPEGALFGPTVQTPFDITKAMGGAIAYASGKPVSSEQRRAALSLIPYGSYLGMREGLQLMTGDSPYTH